MINEEPFRQRILVALTELLQGITPENGYRHDLSKAVFRGRAVFGDKDPVPMVSILEAVKEQDGLPTPPDGGTFVGVWPLLIQGWAEDDHDGNPTDMVQRLMADVKCALARHRNEHGRSRNYLGMDGRVDVMTFSQGVARPTDEVSDKSYFWLRLDLALVENMLDPYA